MLVQTGGTDSERRQFARALLPMTVTVDGTLHKGRDLSLGGMSLFDIRRPLVGRQMVKVAINWRDIRVEFVVEAEPVRNDIEENVQTFKFVGLTKMQASLISLIMHRDEKEQVN